MTRLYTAAVLALATSLVASNVQPVAGGHETPSYPSFYPHEIRLELVGEHGVRRVQQGTLHALVGGRTAPSIPEKVAVIESIRSLVLVELPNERKRGGSTISRCDALRRAVDAFKSGPPGFVAYPYPVTPYHSDYLTHVDLIRDREAQRAAATRDRDPGPTTRARGGARVMEVPLDQLLSRHINSLTGWRPAWLKEGWFQTYLILRPRLRDPGRGARADGVFGRLVRGEYDRPETVLTLQRELTQALVDNCDAAVVGYTLRREAVNVDYNAGIENVGFDSQRGLNAPIFLRTVKLKDFIWNGVLRVGVDGQSGVPSTSAAEGTALARLLWSGLADPAVLFHPQGASLIPNRVLWWVPTEDPGFLGRLRSLLGLGSLRDGVAVPADALVPDAGTGTLISAGNGRRAALRVRYKVRTSAFQDGTAMRAADVIYPYVALLGRQKRTKQGNGISEPASDRVIGWVRDHLAGVKVVAVEKESKNFGPLPVSWEMPIIDVYLRDIAPDPAAVAGVAPPWSALPWHVLALMEEAAREGAQVFSKGEMTSSDLMWLDLARVENPARLRGLLDRLAGSAFVPRSLRELVTDDEARRRWRALRAFFDAYGHVLVTNGPYRLRRWNQKEAILTVFRDFSYPLGIGSFDRYPIPRRGYITAITLRGRKVSIAADVETVMKFGRTYEVKRERLRRGLTEGPNAVNPVCRYVVKGAGKDVLQAGEAAYDGEGGFTFTVRSRRAEAVWAAVYIDGNYTNPHIATLDVRERASR